MRPSAQKQKREKTIVHTRMSTGYYQVDTPASHKNKSPPPKMGFSFKCEFLQCAFSWDISIPIDSCSNRVLSTFLGLLSQFGDKVLKIWLVCPQNETGALEGLGAGRATLGIANIYSTFFGHKRLFPTSCLKQSYTTFRTDRSWSIYLP